MKKKSILAWHKNVQQLQTTTLFFIVKNTTKKRFLIPLTQKKATKKIPIQTETETNK